MFGGMYVPFTETMTVCASSAAAASGTMPPSKSTASRTERIFTLFFFFITNPPYRSGYIFLSILYRRAARDVK